MVSLPTSWMLRNDLRTWCKENKKEDGEPYDLYADGLKVYTTINPRMQLYAEEAVAKHLPVLQRVLVSQRNIKSDAVWKGKEKVSRRSHEEQRPLPDAERRKGKRCRDQKDLQYQSADESICVES